MYTKLIITFLLLCCCVYSTFATYGLDLSYFQGDVSVGTFQCLAASGYEFAILEGTAGNSGVVNPHLGSILNSAKSAGIRYVDVYVFLDFERGDPRGQIQEVVTAIRNSGAPFDGMIWHDVEGAQYWGNCDQNQQFLRDAIDEVNNLGLKQGIYSSASQWSPIMCDTDEFSSYPLWYAHYDGWPSFGDFTPFGGWNSPSIKQFQGTTPICGTQIDKDFY